MDADVIIAGAWPTELTLAGGAGPGRAASPGPGEARRRLGRPARQRHRRQALTMLGLPGLYDRFRAISRRPEFANKFGGLHIDLADVPDNPTHRLPVQQPEMARLLAERGLGASIHYDRGNASVTR